MENLLKFYREKHGMKLKQVADILGCHPPQISKLENGELSLRPDWLEKLGKVYNVDPLELLGGVPIETPLESELLKQFRDLSPTQQNYTLREIALRKEVLDGNYLRSQVANSPSSGGGNDYDKASNH
jgi:transcriptional regulator with XRE-family HTH domain